MTSQIICKSLENLLVSKLKFSLIDFILNYSFKLQLIFKLEKFLSLKSN